jgi:hypothetical protein
MLYLDADVLRRPFPCSCANVQVTAFVDLSTIDTKCNTISQLKRGWDSNQFTVLEMPSNLSDRLLSSP